MKDMPAVPAPMTRYVAWHSFGFVDVVEEEILLFRSVVLEVLSDDIVMNIIARGFNYGLYASIIRNISTPSKLNNNTVAAAIYYGDDLTTKKVIMG